MIEEVEEGHVHMVWWDDKYVMEDKRVMYKFALESVIDGEIWGGITPIC